MRTTFTGSSFLYSSSEDEDELEELQVEFEARAPDEDDFHGIKLLVKQLFLRSAAVNISKVTETILNQRFIGSVIKTVQPEEEDDDMGDDDHVYAISTVLNLAEKNKESVSGLRTFLLEQTAAGGDQQVLDYVTDLLNKQVGFLFNERYVNIPAQVTVPLLETNKFSTMSPISSTNKLVSFSMKDMSTF